MTDEIRELLELAAKAAGIRLEWDGDPNSWQPMYYEGKTYHEWNPITSGDALVDLMERLKINVKWLNNYAVATPQETSLWPYAEDYSDHTTRKDALAMAVLRCAAEMGRRVK